MSFTSVYYTFVADRPKMGAAQGLWEGQWSNLCSGTKVACVTNDVVVIDCNSGVCCFVKPNFCTCNDAFIRCFIRPALF